MKTTITIDIDGVTYYGQPARVKKTSLGLEDHGITTAYLTCEWPGGGISVGGYCLDESTGAPDYRRRGTAYGLDHLIRIMEVVGESWEQIPGSEIVVLFDEPNNIGTRAVGIANLLNDKHLILGNHADRWRAVDDEMADR